VVGLADRFVLGHRIVQDAILAACIQPLVRWGADAEGLIQPGQLAIGAAAAELRRQRVAMQFRLMKLAPLLDLIRAP
jgi:hypothetical protein